MRNQKLKKIKIKTSPSETGSRMFTIDLIDLVDSSEDWEGLPDKEKTRRIQSWLDETPDQPYWALDEIIE